MGAPLTLPRHKLSIAEYHRMGIAGVLHEDSRVELIEGELIDMSPIGSQHASVVTTLTELLVSQLRSMAIVMSQNPISLPPDNEPQPDIAVLKMRTDRYRNALPSAADTLLIIEVADSTFEYDREIKLPLYARYGIPEVWLVDLHNAKLDVYREPGSKGYRKLLQPARQETVSPALIAEAQVPLSQIWPT